MTDLQARAEAAADAVLNKHRRVLGNVLGLRSFLYEAALHALQSEGWRPTDAEKRAFTFAFARGWQIADDGNRQCAPAMDDAWKEYAALPAPPEGEG